MKLFWILLVGILLLQALAVHAIVNDVKSAAKINEESYSASVDKKHHHKKINCGHECSRRCKKASRKKICHRACRACCLRCNCVPPGTYGNKKACPCYARLRTHGNKPKCP